MPEPVISVQGIGKTYRIWASPAQRLLSPACEAFADFLPASLGEGMRRSARAGYRDFHALKDITFSVHSGQSFAIIGRNGSGKSTLLQIIAGTLQPTSGQARIRGRIAALLELGSGFNPEFTGRENVYLSGAVLGLRRPEVDAKFNDIAAFADIGDFMEEPVKIYSSGMALRLAFSVVAHIDATVMIIDEALAVGDVYFSQKCMRFLREFKERGTLLFVSHDMSAVRSLCDSALWLEGGAPRLIGRAQDVAAAYLAESNLKQDNREVVNLGSKALASPDHPIRNTTPVESARPALPFPPVKNLLTISSFKRESSSYGDGRIRIIDVRFADSHDLPLSEVMGGDIVELAITVVGIEPTSNVIFGFNLKDRLGQYLIGENSHRGSTGCNVTIQPGEYFRSKFRFQMPVLHRGNYSIAAAVASGTTENHRQQHWIHEALVLSSATDWAHAGLVGLPMLDIAVDKLGDPAGVAKW